MIYIKKLTETDKQELGRQLVSREIYYCVSHLVSELVKLDKYMDELMCVCVKDNWEDPVRDYVDGLDSEKLQMTLGEYDVGSKEDLYEFLEGNDSWQCFGDENRLDPNQYEAYEHWIISDWLARKLEDEGEMISRDVLGLTIWGRCTTGQSIYLDGVIQRIAIETYASVA